MDGEDVACFEDCPSLASVSFSRYDVPTRRNVKN